MKKNVINVIIIILILSLISPMFCTTISLAYEEINIEKNTEIEEKKDTIQEEQNKNDDNLQNQDEENLEQKEEENKEVNQIQSEEKNIETKKQVNSVNQDRSVQTETVTQAITETIEEGTYEIYAVANELKVLDIAWSSSNNGANVEIYERANQNNQKFQIRKNSDGTYSIIAQHSGKALDVEGAKKTNETNVSQYQVHGRDNQKWEIIKNADNTYSFKSKCNGLYLDVYRGIGSNGTNVQVYQRNSGNSQKFILSKVIEKTGSKTINDGIYYINSKAASNRVLEVPSSSLNNGVGIKTSTKKNIASQKFQIVYNASDGTYTITALHTGKSFDVHGGSGKNETAVEQYTKNGGDNQKWIIKEDKTDGTYNIISKCNGLALDIYKGSTQVGAKVQTYRIHGGNSQKFTFELCEKEVGDKSAENGTYRILSYTNNKKVFSIESGSTENSAKLEMNENTKNSMQQKFDIEYIGEGYYKIKSKKSNKVLTVESETPQIESTIRQEEDKNLDTQKWILKKYSGGVYGIVSKCGNLYITLQSSNIQNGQKLQLKGETDLGEQKFVLVNETPAVTTPDLKDGVYQITTKSNTAIDIDNASYSNAANTIIWNNTKAQNQKFQITRIGDTPYYKIIAIHSAKSLDVYGGYTNPGTNVTQFQYNGTDNQQWLIKNSGEGYYNIISKESGLYIDITGGHIDKAGTNVELWYGNEGDAQKFKFTPINIINNNTYHISSKVNLNKVLDVEGASVNDNANIEIWDKNYGDNQKFEVKTEDNINYKIIAKNSKKLLTVTSNNNVVQMEDKNLDTQKWIIEAVENNIGYYKIKSKSNEMYLNINGINVQVSQKNQSSNQLFTFVDLSQKKGIDVSEWNGLINWENVKRSGVEFAIIRAGYRGYRSGGFAEDKYFRINMVGARNAGIKIGVYFFTQAVNEAEAREEANWTINKIREIGFANQINYPIIIDTESSGGNPPGRADGLDVGTRTAVCKAFCDTVKSNGYTPMIYASRDWFYYKLNINQLSSYDAWVAHYTGSQNIHTDYRYHYEIWQYTSSGQVMGIQGKVDMNVGYKNY